MSAVAAPPQIFLSFALADRGLAERVAGALAGADLMVFKAGDVKPGDVWADALRAAMRKSAAVVVVLSSASRRHELSSSVLFEIGAAYGAKKPVHVVVEDARSELPFSLPGLQVTPISRIDELARSLAESA